MLVTLDPKDWQVLISDPEHYVKDLTYPYPMVADSGPDWFSDEPPPRIEVHNAFATVQLNRRDGSAVAGMDRNQCFRIGSDDFRVLEVLHSDGPCVVLRCAMRPAAERKEVGHD